MIQFDKEKHQYKNGSRVYDSVTTVISKYKEPFDSAYWSVYKACKDVISAYSQQEWGDYKRVAGKLAGLPPKEAWQGVPAMYKTYGYKPLKREIEERKAYYLALWDENGHEARVRGTAVHDSKEREILKESGVVSEISGSKVKLTVGSNELLLSQGFDSQHNSHVFPELIISNDYFEIAGMADRVEKYGKDIYIIDYKTSKKIDQEAFMDKTMKEPLQEIPDCNYNHYGLQLSLYGWMLEQQGFIIKGLQIWHLLPPDFVNEKKIVYKLNYHPEFVEKMLVHYRKKELHASDRN